MTFALILAVIICIIAAVITFSLTQVEEKDYNSDKSLSGLIQVYLIWIPGGLILLGLAGLAWYFI